MGGANVAKVGRLLEKPGALQRLKRSIFCDGTQPFRRHLDGDVGIKLGYIYPLFLQVWSTPYLAARVELSRTRTVRIATADLRLFMGYVALFCHTYT